MCYNIIKVDGVSRGRGQGRWRREGGFNLVELLMAMAMSTIIFMAITVLYNFQSAAIQEQNGFLLMQREARFAMDHLRRDLVSLGSNATPNSDIDAQVCPKPSGGPLQALSLADNVGYVYNSDDNPNIRRISLTLFGGLDVRRRFRTAGIAGEVVTLVADDPAQPLPGTEEVWNDTFTTDRFLRLSGADGGSFYFPIVATSFKDKSISLSSPPPRIAGTSRCGYQGFGDGMWADVQGFIRYSVIADQRPGAPKDSSGNWRRSLLVRDRLATDGDKLSQRLVLAENVVELGIYDVAYDSQTAPDVVTLQQEFIHDDIFGGTKLTGKSGASPEQLRFLTIKLSVRGEYHNKALAHVPRLSIYHPLRTYKSFPKEAGASQVMTVGGRITMPALVARNL